MHNIQGTFQSKVIQRELLSEDLRSFDNSRGYISIQKEFNIPLESPWKQIETIKRKKVKLFDSPLLNDKETTSLNFSTDKKEEDILSKFVQWGTFPIISSDDRPTLQKKHIQYPKTEFMRNHNARINIQKEEQEKYFRQTKTRTQMVQVPQINKNNHYDVKEDNLNLNQQQQQDPKIAKKYAEEFNNYIIKDISTTRRILPQLERLQNDKKKISESNIVNRQRRVYSVIDQSFLQKSDNLDETIDDNLDQKINLRKRRTQIKKCKLKIRLIFVLAVVRISRKYIVQLKERASGVSNLDQQKVVHQKFIDQFGIKNLKYQQKAFAEGIFSKLNSIFQNQKYIKECEEVQRNSDILNRDLKKQRFCQFVSFFLETLDIVTNQQVMSPVLIHLMNLNFFKTNNTQTSLFVANRARYYTIYMHEMTKDQQLLIASEYLLFSQIIPNIFEVFNDLNAKTLEHKNQTLSYLTALCELIQIYFVDNFANLEKIKNKNVRPIQRTFQLQTEENTGFSKAEVIYTSTINSNESIIVEKGFDRSNIKELQNSKPYWDEKMKQKFSKILSNIEKMILIKQN
ncbi:unnamed protein product [Paramecium sonneborni]|uniref:Uncharacterized protein n=1 Tax=Paramecium sonneborni TaxID=65129 RepID=A0A8S1MFR5_9CILI|nr:unnamed protein product [Paramecium sonneborni]